MKRFLFTTVSILAVASAANAAPATTTQSSDWFFKPYVGADYQFGHYGNEDFGSGVKSDDLMKTNLNGGNVHIGARVHKYLGVELGYFQTEEGNKDNILGSGLDSKVKIKGGTLDLMGYVPVAPKTELIGTVGVSYSKADLSIPSVVSGSENEWKPRVGGGAQYWITDNLNARALVRYQGADFDKSVDNAVVATAGINWQF